MADLRLSISCGSYDRTLPLLDGRVKPEGIQLEFVPTLRPGSPMGSPDADMYEASITAELMKDVQESHIALPIFPRRKFTHQLLLTRTDSGISSLEEFVGKKIGILRGYAHPLGVWLRGYLKDKHGIPAEQIHWFTESQGSYSEVSMKEVQMTLIPKGKSLVQMLVAGELDVLAEENAHRLVQEHPNLRRVFPNFKEAETDYFKEAGFFPSYHVMAIKKRVVGEHGWSVGSLLKAYEDAKQMALEALDRDNSLLSSPWVSHLLQEQASLLNRDMYPYGLAANKNELETLTRYLYQQGLTTRQVPVQEVFAQEIS